MASSRSTNTSSENNSANRRITAKVRNNNRITDSLPVAFLSKPKVTPRSEKTAFDTVTRMVCINCQKRKKK